jgi:hypothetical protein
MNKPVNPYWKGRIGTVDLLILTCSDQLLHLLKIHSFFFYKTSYINEEVNCTQPSPSVRVSAASVTREKVSNVDFRLSEIEAQLTSEEYGKDLTSVQNLLKKHALLEADIGSHQDRIDGVKIAAEQFCQVSVA